MRIYVSVFLIFLTTKIFCQDTVFVNKHHFSSPVRNVLLANGQVEVKTGKGLYRRAKNGWDLIRNNFSKRYLFYDSSYYETDYIPIFFRTDPYKMDHLIPQKSLSSPSYVRQGNSLFISVGGSLFEYEINYYYKRSYNQSSIRDIYKDDTIKVISTYSGVYINDSIKVSEPTYSNGFMSKIGNRYFLCVDDIYELSNGRFERIEKKITEDKGLFRKLLSVNDTIYAYLTRSILYYDSISEWTSIHQKAIYTDIVELNGRIYFSTKSGEIFSLINGEINSVAKFDSPVMAIYPIKDELYIGTDNGVHVINPKTNITFKKHNIQRVVGFALDLNNNLWISSENGLYLCPNNEEYTIPYVSDVEFNYGAINLYFDNLFVGSIVGLYEIDVQNVMREFLPKYIARNKENTGYDYVLYSIIIIVLITITLVVIKYKKNRRNQEIDITKNPSLSQLKHLINEKNIISVEELAEHLKTNTVQLNRLFKTYETTPGKFLRKEKLIIAKKMMSKNQPMEEIVRRTGYSAEYIRKNNP